MSFGHKAQKLEGHIFYSPMFIVHLGIIILIPMHLSGLLNEIFSQQFCHKYAVILYNTLVVFYPQPDTPIVPSHYP